MTTKGRVAVALAFAGVAFAGSSAEAQTVIQVPGGVADLQAAIDQVPDGGVIEIADGTYLAPSTPSPGGFLIANTGRRFTIRAAMGATVRLTRPRFVTVPILRFVNGSLGSSGPVVFEKDRKSTRLNSSHSQ